jgi:hypothetical protein
MNELELQLRELGRELDLPAGPDLAPAVLVRLEGRPFPWRRAAVLALAVLAVAIAAAFAVPQARTTILHWFHIGGATIERVETLPPAVERSQAGGLGRPMSLREAERAVGFHLLLPPYKCCGPGRVYVLGDSMATVILRIGKNHRALLSEFPSFGEITLKKLTIGETRLEWVELGGRAAAWIHGGTHALKYFDKRLGVREKAVLIHGNVLIWVQGRLTLRLEGRLTKAEALFWARQIK